MKKILAVLAVMAFALTGCGKDEPPPQAQNQQYQQQVQQAAVPQAQPGQPVIINNQPAPQQSNTGDMLMGGMMGYMLGSMGNSHGNNYAPTPQVVHKTVIVQHVTPPPAAPTPTYRQPSSYSSPSPKPTVTYRTPTSSPSGIGSSAYRSSSSSFSSSRSFSGGSSFRR